MPWTAKQLKLFRAAAHNPAIAKSSGIKQADAERMSKEGLKKMAFGGKAKINKQDTKHGKMDMPFTNLNRFAGMKKGGMMKKRRFDGGGDVVDDSVEPEVERKSFAAGISAKNREYKEPASKTAKSNLKNYGDEKDSGPKEDTSPARNIKSVRKAALPSKEQLNTNAERMAKIGEGVAMALPVGRVAKGAHDVGKAASAIRNAATKYAETPAMRATSKANEARFLSREASARNRLGSKDIEDFKKGGFMKESKAMVGKEVAFMKKKGAPASMIKHEKAEMKGFAKGGGIESRGKTKGTMIRMASGGSVSSASRRADGIAQRGKTRC
jgi:hypothetical protein